jgi:hypothetical protein
MKKYNVIENHSPPLMQTYSSTFYKNIFFNPEYLFVNLASMVNVD